MDVCHPMGNFVHYLNYYKTAFDATRRLYYIHSIIIIITRIARVNYKEARETKSFADKKERPRAN